MPAPYSDNLYSADTSDEEDVEAQDIAPSNGYFHASSAWGPTSPSQQHLQPFSVPYVPNVLVEDPSLPANKAREAEEERLSIGQSAEGSVRPSNPHRRSVEDDLNDHSTPHTSLPGVRTTFPPRAVDAPPAYSPSPSSPSTSYQTFSLQSSAARSHDEQQPLLPRGPESMGGSPLELSEPCRWQRVQRCAKKCARKCFTRANSMRLMKVILGALLIITVVVVIASWFKDNEWHPRTGLEDDDPIRSPDMEHPEFVWEPRDGCLNRPYKFPKTSSPLDLRPDRNLEIGQDMAENREPKGARQTNIWGEVILRTAADGNPGTIDFEVIANDVSLQPDVNINFDSRAFEITTPQWVDWDQEMSPCIQIRITVWLPARSIVNFLTVDTVHLDVSIKQGVTLAVLGAQIFRTIHGNMNTPQAALTGDMDMPYTIDGRSLSVRSVSGNITGWFPLYDMMFVETAYGNIKANITTKPVRPEDPRWAVIDAFTVSGNIDIQELFEPDVNPNALHRKFPAREYSAHLETVSGNVKANLAWTSRGEFFSKSGDMDIRLWPVLHLDMLEDKLGYTPPRLPRLVTDNKSGHTKLTMLEPWWTSFTTSHWPVLPEPQEHGDSEKPGATIRDHETPDNVTALDKPMIHMLKSDHKSLSGDMILRYPSAWDGSLEAYIISGSQNVRGKDLDVHQNRLRYPPGVTGRKGVGLSGMKIDTVSGDQDVLIGEEPEDD